MLVFMIVVLFGLCTLCVGQKIKACKDDKTSRREPIDEKEMYY